MKPIFFVAATTLFTLATAMSVSADDRDGQGCSNASLKGRYGLATHGERFGVYDQKEVLHFYTGPSGDLAPVRVDQISEETFDGRGNTTQSASVFANGSSTTGGTFTTPPVAGTYTVNQDCTGTEVFPNFMERVFVLSNGGRTIHILETYLHLTLPAAASAGVDCSKGCDLAAQFYTDGERY
jgi:hypothetical protein